MGCAFWPKEAPQLRLVYSYDGVPTDEIQFDRSAFRHFNNMPKVGTKDKLSNHRGRGERHRLPQTNCAPGDPPSSNDSIPQRLARSLLHHCGTAAALCGTYVGSGGSDLYTHATHFVMLRDGNTTVMSMQNKDEGPPEDFAMVVPVPMVLEKSMVQRLAPELFDKIDQIAAPRLDHHAAAHP